MLTIELLLRFQYKHIKPGKVINSKLCPIKFLEIQIRIKRLRKKNLYLDASIYAEKDKINLYY